MHSVYLSRALPCGELHGSLISSDNPGSDTHKYHFMNYVNEIQLKALIRRILMPVPENISAT